MKPFTKTPVCPKCGCRDIHTTFHRAVANAWMNYGDDCEYGDVCREAGAKTEHLHRFCRGCSFDWNTRTKPPYKPSVLRKKQ